VIFFATLTSTPLIEGNSGNGEIFMILPAILGILTGLDKKYFLSGVFFSFAFLLKAPAIFDFAAFLIFVGLLNNRWDCRPSLKVLFQLTGGFLLPFLLTMIFFATKGALSAYLTAALSFNVSYLASNNHFIIENGLLIVKAIPLLMVVAYFLAKYFFQPKRRKGTKIGFFEFLLIWLVFSFYGAAFAGRPYEHYLIQVVPSFSLIAAAIISQKDLARIGGLFLTAAVVLTLALGFRPAIQPSYYPNFFRYISSRVAFDSYADSFKPGTSRNYALASFLTGCKKFNQENTCTESRTKPSDKLYVFLDAPAIYFLSGLDPATRYVNFYHVNEDKAAQEKAAKEIGQNKPAYILVEKGQEAGFPALEKILHSRYNRFAFYEDTAIYQLFPNTTP
jgi:hypothetical protein